MAIVSHVPREEDLYRDESTERVGEACAVETRAEKCGLDEALDREVYGRRRAGDGVLRGDVSDYEGQHTVALASQV